MRITSRNRPRLGEYPWPLRTKQTTLEALNEAGSGRHPNLIGPLNIAAVMDMLYLVKELDYEATIDGDFAFGGVTSHASDEIETWEITRYNPATGDPVLSPEYDDFYTILIDTDHASDHGPHEIFEDDNGKYWLSGKLGGGDGFAVAITSEDMVTNTIIIDADLVLPSGTHTIKMAASNTFETPTTATMTITATGYHPYATTTGDPAYSTTTGEPINGGP
jgi:hypothetical protein